MAITDITTSEEFIAGAPNIKLKGDLRPNRIAARYPEEGVMEFDEEVITPYDLQKEEGVNIGPMAGTTMESPKELYRKAIQEGTFDGTFDEFEEELERLRSKFMASGGRVQYGLGSLVKSIGKTAKKVAKSPVGKAALLYAAGFGIPGTNFGGLLGTSAGSMFGARQGMFGTYGPMSALQNLGLMKSAAGDMAATKSGPLSKFLGSKGALAGAGIGLASVLSAADVDTSNPSEMPRSTEELQALLRRGYKNLNPRADEVEVEEFVRVNSANGGRIGYAFGTPDTAQAAGIMGNLPVRQNKAGVSEVDLRDTGGFIPPVGVKEKADDVPAMLSNNEFVMTADAVRAAGGGSVNVGAQRMYDLMKNLESRMV
jgi:hypothetical protein